MRQLVVVWWLVHGAGAPAAGSRLSCPFRCTGGLAATLTSVAGTCCTLCCRWSVGAGAWGDAAAADVQTGGRWRLQPRAAAGRCWSGWWSSTRAACGGHGGPRYPGDKQKDRGTLTALRRLDVPWCTRGLVVSLVL